MSEISVKNLKHHWQEEGDAQMLYTLLAELEKDSARKKIFANLAEVERQHQEIFGKLLKEKGVDLKEFSPSFRAKVLAWMARNGNAGTVLSLLTSEEAKMVKEYLKTSQQAASDDASKAMQKVANESVHHAEVLMEIKGKQGEPWHKTESGGFVKNTVYGFNDGLTANFGLVMGVLGAGEMKLVILAGVAGLVADALSMGSSGYLAAKSEQEVYQHEIEMEKEEIRLMPELEAKELALIYEAKGMPAEAAKKAADQVMSDPELALKEKTSAELGISDDLGSPLKDGAWTGLATAFGAFIPVFPFLVFTETTAIVVSIILSMLSHFGVGAARSFFTGRGIFRSGIDMFLVGMGIAIIGYFVGIWIEAIL